MNIGVYIETGGINTLTTSDSIIDQLAALDQAESQFRSENIKFGIRHRMRSRKTLLNHTRFLGYTKGPDGVLQMASDFPKQSPDNRFCLTDKWFLWPDLLRLLQ